MNRLAALYVRVSTLQQEQEATIESQVAAIESYAQAQGYRLSQELYFLDQASTPSLVRRVLRQGTDGVTVRVCGKGRF
jgi:DNA invertase Pin-like site-specific DNA recombinase